LGAGVLGSNVMRPDVVPGQSPTNTAGLPANSSGIRPSFNYNAFMQPGQACHGLTSTSVCAGNPSATAGSANEFLFGNAPRYLSDVRLPAYWDLDALLSKKTRITESMSATFRIEALNALNHPVFGAPDLGVTDTNFGYNTHTQANTPRYVQISGRFTF
jgi:hypothetical protein